MKRFTPTLLAAAIGGFVLNTSQIASAADSETSYDEEIIITSIRENRQSRGATGLSLSVFETPQSLTILDAGTLDEFALNDVNSMLKMTTGINVDSTETDRTYYNARGFDITSMHVDSIGIPFGSLIVGDLDTAIYEKVEVIRGSNGLITGLGNPSGTINYVRKRPGNDFAMSTKFTVGSWDKKRVEADASVPLTESGSWAARFVGVNQNSESWLGHYENDRNVASLVVDGQVGRSFTVALGYTRQDNNSDGVLWGATPVIYSNGAMRDFDESSTTAMDWTHWDTLTETAFIELGWQISGNLSLTTTVTQTEYEDNSELFYVYWNTGLDPETGLGMLSYPGKFDGSEESLIWDTAVQGKFDAFGQEHEFNLGLSLAEKESKDLDYTALTGFVDMPAFPGWTGNEVARPQWAAPFTAATDDMQLNRLYGSLLLSMTDNFKLILGMNVVDYENEGESWGVSTDSAETGSSPYIGFTWALLDDLNLYASYSDIYQPQYYLDENLEALGSAEGKSYEFGLKKQFNNNLLVSVAIFRTKQENLQEFVGYDDGDGVEDDDFSDDFNFALYRGISIDAEGVELEVAGEVVDGLSLQAGLTHQKLKDFNGDEARTFIPRNTLKLLASWKPAWQENLGMGLSARWQDEVYYDSAFGRISQDGYVVVGGYVSYELSKSTSLSLNLDNLTDEEYYSSVKYEQVFAAAPRSFSLSLDMNF